jgi:hypothetical protein
MKEFWDQRYNEEGWAYGSEPNEFVKEQLDILKLECEPTSTKLLFPAEGEGRNAVFAALLGFDVYAFDISHSGKAKAESLATMHETSISYLVSSFDSLTIEKESMDGLVFCYTHFPKNLQPLFIEKMLTLLKPEGRIIFECFSENNLPFRKSNPNVGGPDNIDMLYTINSVQELFNNCSELQVQETVVQLNEGKYHVGEGCVIRMTGRKSSISNFNNTENYIRPNIR